MPPPAPTTPRTCAQCGTVAVPTARWWRLPLRQLSRSTWACGPACRDAWHAASLRRRRAAP